MATVEKVICSGQGFSVSIVLDDVAKTFSGVHGINTSANPVTILFTFNGVNRDRVLPAGADVVVNLPAPRPYNEVPGKFDGTAIVIPGLDSIGAAS